MSIIRTLEFMKTIYARGVQAEVGSLGTMTSRKAGRQVESREVTAGGHPERCEMAVWLNRMECMSF